jgi:hypothetical protein
MDDLAGKPGVLSYLTFAWAGRGTMRWHCRRRARRGKTRRPESHRAASSSNCRWPVSPDTEVKYLRGCVMVRAADRPSCEACPATSWTYRKSLISGDHQSDAFVMPVMVLTRRSRAVHWPSCLLRLPGCHGRRCSGRNGNCLSPSAPSRVPRAFRVLTDSELQGPRPVSLLSPSWKGPLVVFGICIFGWPEIGCKARLGWRHALTCKREKPHTILGKQLNPGCRPFAPTGIVKHAYSPAETASATSFNATY